MDIQASADVQFNELNQVHKNILLDTVLSFAKLDGSIAYLRAVIEGRDVIEASREYGLEKASAHLQKIYKYCRDNAVTSVLAPHFKTYKKAYENYYKTRHHIVHSYCVGSSASDQDILVFLKFEVHGSDKLAQDRIHISEFQKSIQWAKKFDELCWKLIDEIRPSET